MQNFPESFWSMLNELAQECHQNSVRHGFWDEGIKDVRTDDGFHGINVERFVTNPWNFGEKIALIHSELSEALEKHRKTVGKGLPDSPDEHCPEHGGIGIELADAVIRIMDLCGKMEIDLAEAIRAKMKYNSGRPAKHGKAY